MAFNIRTFQVEDPIKGIKDLNTGVLHCGNFSLLGEDYFKLFSIFKTSAKMGLKMDSKLNDFIIKNSDIIKMYFVYHFNRTIHKFRKITNDDKSENSLRAFKLCYDYSLFDFFVNFDNLPKYVFNKQYYDNKIFNLVLVSEFMIENIKLFDIDKAMKHYIYINAFEIAFDENFNCCNHCNHCNNDKKKEKTKVRKRSRGSPNKVENEKIILFIANRYCEIEDCGKEFIKKINLSVLDKLIKQEF